MKVRSLVCCLALLPSGCGEPNRPDQQAERSRGITLADLRPLQAELIRGVESLQDRLPALEAETATARQQLRDNLAAMAACQRSLAAARELSAARVEQYQLVLSWPAGAMRTDGRQVSAARLREQSRYHADRQELLARQEAAMAVQRQQQEQLGTRLEQRQARLAAASQELQRMQSQLADLSLLLNQLPVGSAATAADFENWDNCYQCMREHSASLREQHALLADTR